MQQKQNWEKYHGFNPSLQPRDESSKMHYSASEHSYLERKKQTKMFLTARPSDFLFQTHLESLMIPILALGW